jgi:hypothetical protein
MTEPHLFWTVFSAVLAAIILGGVFFWGAITYTRMEREGVEHTKKGNAVFLAVILPIVVLASGLYTVL